MGKTPGESRLACRREATPLGTFALFLLKQEDDVSNVGSSWRCMLKEALVSQAGPSSRDCDRFRSDSGEYRRKSTMPGAHGATSIYSHSPTFVIGSEIVLQIGTVRSTCVGRAAELGPLGRQFIGSQTRTVAPAETYAGVNCSR